MKIGGLRYVSEYLSTAEQDGLLATVDAAPWRDDLRRRVQHYGYRYDYTRKRVDPELYLGPLRQWAAELAKRLRADGHTAHTLDQVIVNEYLPGQRIGRRTRT